MSTSLKHVMYKISLLFSLSFFPSLVPLSIGDYVAQDVGVTFSADLTTRRITPLNKFLILGSDGIYDFLSNEQLCSICSNFMHKKKFVKNHPPLLSTSGAPLQQRDGMPVGTGAMIMGDPAKICESVVFEGVRRWSRGEQGAVDDISIICIFLNAHPGKA